MGVCVLHTRESKLTIISVPYHFFLKVLEQIQAKMLLQTVRVKSKETLKAISETMRSVFICKTTKLIVHFTVKVITKKKRPKSEQGNHLLTLSNACKMGMLHIW